MFNKLKRYCKDPYYALGSDMIKRHPKMMSDKYYIKVLWKMVMGYELDLKHPKTFNEKLQWLKLYDRKALYTRLVDKIEVKQWAAEKIGVDYIVPTLAVYESVEDIDLDKLPDQFVLKCNHDSGSVIICQDKKLFNLELAKKTLSEGLNHNFFWDAREWPYKKVKRRIFAEQYIEDKDTHELPDYKFFSFNGEAKALFIATGRQNPQDETRFDFFDMNFQHLDVTNGHPNADIIPSKPRAFNKMRELANELSKGIPQVRCDFYEVNGRVFLGEMTLFHWGGTTPFNPRSFDEEMGSWIKLPID